MLEHMQMLSADNENLNGMDPDIRGKKPEWKDQLGGLE
jgi:hypothetical protein